MAEAKEPREKLTVAVDPPVRDALRRRADELDITPGAVARHVLSSWARSVAADAGPRLAAAICLCAALMTFSALWGAA